MPRTAFEPLPSASPPPVASEPPEAAPAEAEAPSGEPEALDPTASAEPAAALEPAVAAGIEEPRIELIPERAAAQAPGAAEVLPSATAPFQPAPAVARTAGPPSAPGIEVLRTTWHPRPERRVARVRLAGRPAPLDVHEGDAVSTLVVKTIEPSGVLFLHGSQELRRGVGER
jgi:hypothetical protein